VKTARIHYQFVCVNGDKMKKPYCDAGQIEDCFHMELDKSGEEWICSMACGLSVDVIEKGECPLEIIKERGC